MSTIVVEFHFLFNLSGVRVDGFRGGRKNQVEILVGNLLFQEMNEEKFFICLILRMSRRTSSVTLKWKKWSLCNYEADKNVIYAERPPNHRKIHNDKFVSQTYSSLSPIISFRSVLSRVSFFFWYTSSKKEKKDCP